MSNPKSGYGQPSPDTYGSATWNNQQDGHYRSGIINKWFFLISDGGSGTNDLGNAYSVNGVGIDKASKIAYRTEILLNSSATYAMARTISIQAARDLYGINSCEESTVTKAWYAVGVGVNFVGVPGPIPTIVGDTVLCTPSTYTITNLPTGSTATWPLSGYYTVTPQNAAATIVTVTKTNSGAAFLSANVNFNGNLPCGISTPTYYASKFIKFGSPLATTQTPYWTQNGSTNYMNDCNTVTDQDAYSTYGSGYVNDNVGNTIVWSKVSAATNSRFTWSTSGQMFTVSILNKYKTPTDFIILRATVTNQCGTAFRDYKFVLDASLCTVARPVRTVTKNKSLLLYPNPFSSNCTIEIKQASTVNSIKDVIIKNKLGVELKRFKFSANLTKQIIDLAFLPMDVYTIQVFDGEKWFIEKLIKN